MKTQPVASHVINDRWVEHCKRLHKERLEKMKSRIDQSEPESMQVQLDPFNNPKRKQQQRDRQAAIDTENRILLEKLIKIKSTHTESTFKPFLGRSTFQHKGGGSIYVDSSSGTKCIDHLNPNMTSSPISIHHSRHPSKNGPPASNTYRQTQVAEENMKLLKAIAECKPSHDTDALERSYLQSTDYRRNASKFRGPLSAFYGPPGLIHSPRSGSPPRVSDGRIRPGSAVPGSDWRSRPGSAVPASASPYAGARPPSAHPYLRNQPRGVGGARPLRPQLTTSGNRRPSTAPLSRTSPAPPTSAEVISGQRTEYRPVSASKGAPPSRFSRPALALRSQQDTAKDYGWGKDPSEGPLITQIDEGIEDAEIDEEEEIDLMVETPQDHQTHNNHEGKHVIEKEEVPIVAPGVGEKNVQAMLSLVGQPGYRPKVKKSPPSFVFRESSHPAVKGKRNSGSVASASASASASAAGDKDEGGHESPSPSPLPAGRGMAPFAPTGPAPPSRTPKSKQGDARSQTSKSSLGGFSAADAPEGIKEETRDRLAKLTDPGFRKANRSAFIASSFKSGQGSPAKDGTPPPPPPPPPGDGGDEGGEEEVLAGRKGSMNDAALNALKQVEMEKQYPELQSFRIRPDPPLPPTPPPPPPPGPDPDPDPDPPLPYPTKSDEEDEYEDEFEEKKKEEEEEEGEEEEEEEGEEEEEEEEEEEKTFVPENEEEEEMASVCASFARHTSIQGAKGDSKKGKTPIVTEEEEEDDDVIEDYGLISPPEASEASDDETSSKAGNGPGKPKGRFTRETEVSDFLSVESSLPTFVPGFDD